MSELTRVALRGYLGVLAPGERRHLLSAAVGRSGRGDLAENIEEILAGELD